ncbi:alpha/beta-hydrolase [Mollisia scopiformis]|uniref:Alpha/beta-hydrolase n=1 Tax=Mollisia scopiformis TaxID=149040 RepID=A0A132BDN9_MOLSC|nr:alpha/beta-hydrolase [Mollisia scopiformis]KUJ10363.1 alpha/beta-hydrolase [Mollisia scopiformis]
MSPWGKMLLNARKQPASFKISIPEQQLSEFYALLKLSHIPPLTYESAHEDQKFGVNHRWMTNAKEHWLSKFDWRECEKHMNRSSHFKVPVEDRTSNTTFDIHFVALFSANADATPILLLHGWPGSFLEFLPIISLVKSHYTPETLPYHLIVPSLPGYAFSSPPPLDRDFRVEDIARVMNQLMLDLGFGSGYVVQGGDIGSKVARVIAVEHEACKAVHLNFGIMPEPQTADPSKYTALEKTGLQRGREFHRIGSAYALEHATCPSTIAFTKFLTWSDPTSTSSLDTILEAVTLYYLTDTFPKAIYPYRQLFTPGNIGAHENPIWRINKPFGFSWFPNEIAPVPRNWVESTTDEKLIYWREHEKGGHFAALERPETLWGDLKEFVDQVFA